VRALAVGLEDSDIAVQARTMSSLEGVTGKDFGRDAHKWIAYTRSGSTEPPSASVAQRIGRWLPWN
jgi:hypothetical protein